MKQDTINEVKRAARTAATPEQLFNMLTEEHLLKSGQKVYIAGSMGQTNVVATFQRMTSGGYAVVKTSQGELSVLPQKVRPIKNGSMI